MGNTLLLVLFDRIYFMAEPAANFTKVIIFCFYSSSRTFLEQLENNRLINNIAQVHHESRKNLDCCEVWTTRGPKKHSKLCEATLALHILKLTRYVGHPVL